MSRYRVYPVTSATGRRRFVDFPYTHYDGERCWVPPLRRDQLALLDPKKNPFFEHGQIQPFLAEDETGTVVGRVAAILNGQHLAKYDDATGYFGFFESIDEPAVASALLSAAEAWLQGHGLTTIRGPVNPSVNETAGLLVEGFDRPPSILMPYNFPYYDALLAGHGYARAMKMWAYYVHDAYVQVDKLRRGAEAVMRRNPGLRLRTLDLKNFWDDARTILHVYNEAWSGNWGSVPMTEREFEHLANELKQIIEPELVYILERDGAPVAFSISVPNLNRALRHVPDGRLFPTGLAKLLAYGKLGIYEIRMPLMGVLPAYHGRGFDAPLIYETIRVGRERGYEACEMSWVLDVNTPLVNALDKLGAVRDKEYALYERTL